MIETIGKIKLDLSKYPGEDYYNDGDVEEELLKIVQEIPSEKFTEVIQEKKQWPILYHLSPLRENIVEWLPIGRTDKVLEVGSGCGAITGAFAAKAGEVTCVDLSKRRSQINAYRHSGCDNVTIHVGNFKDIEPGLPCDYSYICLIGAFEYGQGYIGGETPYEDFLKMLLSHLAPGGRIVIAIENKYGLKYFAGCREDHLGTFFGGIEDYSDGGVVRTFGKAGLEQIFASCGAPEWHFYYPYPDYKFMTTLYSDERLPGKGELLSNLRNFDRDRMLLFDEKAAFDGLVKEGLFPQFSNSYVAVLGGALPVKYVKYSNDRSADFVIKTQIEAGEDGRLWVYKSPLSEKAVKHIERLRIFYEKLQERYQGGRLNINRCELIQKQGFPVCARFEYLEGTPLSELMDTCLKKGSREDFYQYFREYMERIGYHSEYPVSDYDLAFSNILVSGDIWTVIDYEWTFERPIDVKEIAYRAVYCYLLEDEKRRALDEARILEELNLTPQEAEACQCKEMDFQKFVTGGRKSMSQIRDDIGYCVLRPQELFDRHADRLRASRVQIYEDRGNGYHEETSYFVSEAYKEEGFIDLSLHVSGDVKSLRIDPAMDFCIVRLRKVTWNGADVNMRIRHFLTVNGKIVRPKGEGLPDIIFPTEDPNINFRLERLQRRQENVLTVQMEIARIPAGIARDMA